MNNENILRLKLDTNIIILYIYVNIYSPFNF